MGYDTNGSLEQTIVLEKVNPLVDSPLPTTLGSGLTMLELVNKLLRVVNEAVGNDIAMSKNFTALLSAFEGLREYVNERGYGDGSITTEMLADGGVTREKLAALAVGFTQLANESVYGDKIKRGGVQTYHIADGAIMSSQLAGSAVQTDKIANRAVTTNKVADGAITADKLAALAVGFTQLANQSVYGDKIKRGGVQTYHIADGAIMSSQLAGSAVQTDKIANRAVTTNKVADGAITRDKLSDDLKNSTGALPLVLYGNLDNTTPEAYLSDPAYGDEAMRAILTGRRILVRTPNANMIGADSSHILSTPQYTAIFSPVLLYQLPNYENDYLYLFYLRDEKQILDMSAIGAGAIEIPVYGQLKMKLSVKHLSCPVEHLTTEEYANLVMGLTDPPLTAVTAT